MNRTGPPYLLERLLLLLLPVRDQETISGDLREEFREAKIAELGPIGARAWYTRQVLSFLPARAVTVFLHGAPLRCVCFFTALAAFWLGTMDVILHHPGRQIAIAATILAQALLTLAALQFRRLEALRILAKIGSLPVLWLAGSALWGVFAGADFEGYILLIALALIFQVALTLFTLPRVQPS